MKNQEQIQEAEVNKDLFDPAIVAKQIDKIDSAFSHLQKGGLNRTAIVALVCNYTKLSRKIVEKVLDSLQDFKRYYTAQAPKK